MVILLNNIEPFAAISEAFFWAISLYDKIDKSLIDKNTIGLMSGIKYVNNVMKHCDEVFALYSFCHPGICISVKVDDGEDGPIIQTVNIDSTLVFGKIEDIPVKPVNKNQRKNYVTWLQEKSIPVILKSLDNVLVNLYPCCLLYTSRCV